MRNNVTVAAVFCILTFSPLLECQDLPSDALFSPDQLDNLLAPVALYPDPLLAQVLVAATFPDQIDDAARFVRADSNPNDIDGQSWDVSVKSVAHYATALYLMADQLDWTTSLGQAYVNQSDAVMAAVQRLRAQAQAVGNLQSNADMQVLDDGGDIEIWPAQPQYIFVPEYDPAVVYVGTTGFNFGSGFSIGAWLNCDFDWHAHRVIYHGWNENRGWITRSKPFVRPTATYVNERLRYVATNHSVVNHAVNYNNLNRFESVHRGLGYSPVHPVSPPRANYGNPNPASNNGITQRNFKADSASVDDRRERVQEPARRQFDPAPVHQPRPDVNATREPAPPVAPPRMQPPAPSAFTGNQRGFDSRNFGGRGQSGSQEIQRPAPESRPAPAPRPAPESRPAPAQRPAPEPHPAPAIRQESPSHPAPAAHEERERKR